MEILHRIFLLIVGVSLSALIPLGILKLFITIADLKEKNDANTENKRRKDA